jgi:hypothetical protein
MLTDLQHLLPANNSLCILFDALYFLIPCLLTIAVMYKWKLKKTLAIAASLFILIYGIYISSFSYLSIEFIMSWFFIPLVFYPNSEKGFYYVLSCLRLIFILIFFSAGLWKIRAGGIFNMEQMSAILLQQHKELLVTSPSHWYAQFIYYLIKHPAGSYFLYLGSGITELFFLAGIFTRKFDKILLLSFILFLLFDLLVMQIYYFSWLGFAGLLYFSKFKLKQTN